MLWYILGGIAVLIVVFVLIVAMRPPSFRVSRTATMNAPPATVFNQVNDFHNWINWSPWEKLDPNLNRMHEGPVAGTGAKYSWVGNKQVGEGRMTITDSKPNELVRILLEFIKPFKSTNNTEFTFQPSGNQTEVHWTMLGQHTFVTKAFCLFMNMDKMIGKDFEKGLNQMRAAVEAKK